MATQEESARDIIDQALAREPDAIVNSSIFLLELLANTLVGMIGEQGFETLLYRSAQRVNRDFPWLMFDPHSRGADPEFDLLRHCFEGQDLAQASAASTLLFHTLTGLLSTLIGTHMTLTVLRSAKKNEGAQRWASA